MGCRSIITEAIFQFVHVTINLSCLLQSLAFCYFSWKENQCRNEKHTNCRGKYHMWRKCKAPWGRTGLQTQFWHPNNQNVQKVQVCPGVELPSKWHEESFRVCRVSALNSHLDRPELQMCHLSRFGRLVNMFNGLLLNFLFFIFMIAPSILKIPWSLRLYHHFRCSVFCLTFWH